MNLKFGIKTGLWVIIGLIIISTIILIGFYIFQFYGRPLSEDPAQWGQFGDYFGGVLNPLFGLGNLIVLIILTLYISNIEDKRSLKTLHNQSKPLPHISLEIIHHSADVTSGIFIKIKNCGLGPMIITKIKINGNDKTQYNNFLYIRDHKIPKGGECSIYESEGYGVIDKGGEEILFSVEQNKNNTDLNYMKGIFTILKEYEINIEYIDIYDNKFTTERSIKQSLESLGL